MDLPSGRLETEVTVSSHHMVQRSCYPRSDRIYATNQRLQLFLVQNGNSRSQASAGVTGLDRYPPGCLTSSCYRNEMRAMRLLHHCVNHAIRHISDGDITGVTAGTYGHPAMVFTFVYMRDCREFQRSEDTQ